MTSVRWPAGPAELTLAYMPNPLYIFWTFAVLSQGYTPLDYTAIYFLTQKSNSYKNAQNC